MSISTCVHLLAAPTGEACQWAVNERKVDYWLCAGPVPALVLKWETAQQGLCSDIILYCVYAHVRNRCKQLRPTLELRRAGGMLKRPSETFPDGLFWASRQRPSISAAFWSNRCTGAEWTKVKPMSLRKKPDALIVKKTGEASYAEMLRKLTSDPSLSELGIHVRKIRRT